MSGKKRTSIVYKNPYPEMYIPERLRSPVTVKQFWYQKLISLCVGLWYLGTKPFRKKPATPQPEEKVPPEEEPTVEEKTPPEEKPETSEEGSD